MDIRFYSTEGKLLFICAEYVRVKWCDSLKKEGICEIVLLKDHPLADIVTKNPALLVFYGENQGIVCGYSFEEDFLRIRVRTLITLLSRRLIMGKFGEEELTFSGNPLTIIKDSLLPFADYIVFKGEVRDATAKTVSFECGTNLFKAANELLEGTGVGMKIEFSLSDAVFYFSFIYPEEYLLRLSSGNRNLTSVSAAADRCAVKNAGYCTEHFAEPVEWDSSTDSTLSDYRPGNFLKQYLSVRTTTKLGFEVKSGQYLYCDTQDGKLKVSDEPKTISTRRICIEENPVCVFEDDMRKNNTEQATTLLEIRKYLSEVWSASPLTEKPFTVGTVVSVEKEVGVEKGIKKMQVVSVTTDTESSLPRIELA